MDRKVSKCVEYAATHGIIVNIKKDDNYIMTHAPVTLYPYNFPRLAFTRAISLACMYNILVDRIARSPQWLLETLHTVFD
jgi:hypothetical protein